MDAALTSESNSLSASVDTNNSVECNEEALVAAAKGGCLIAFGKLVDRYERRVFRVARTLAHNREDAEEIVQDAFVHAFTNLSRFRGDSRFYTWLVRITINAGLMKLRRRRLNVISIEDHPKNEDGGSLRALVDSGPNPERHYLQEELREVLAKSIGQIPPTRRRVIELRDVEGLSTEETARALNLSPTAVKSRLRRGRIQLRRSLSQRFNQQRLPRATNVGYG